MSYLPIHKQRRGKRTVSGRGSNTGHCACCGKKANWRSVYNRCWRCEMDELRTRRPIHLDHDLLVSLTGVRD